MKAKVVREDVTFRLDADKLDALDAEIEHLVGGIPGAKLSRAAFVEPIVLAELARRRETREAAADLRTGPKEHALTPAKSARKA